MSRVAVLLAEGFEEIEAIAIIYILRRAELDVTTVGVSGTTVTGSNDGAVSADTTLDATLDASTGETFDCVVLPGGLPGATNLRDDERVQSLIRRQNEAGRQLAAICAAPIALGKAGVLEGRSATCYPGFEEELRGANPSEDRVVDDGNVVTSRGPGTVFDFSLALVAKLKDSETAEALRNGMLLTT